MNPAPFWIVWSPEGSRPPRYRHNSVNTAEAEARRLAAEHPGQDFYVARIIGRAQMPQGVSYVYHEGALDMDVPF